MLLMLSVALIYLLIFILNGSMNLRKLRPGQLWRYTACSGDISLNQIQEVVEIQRGVVTYRVLYTHNTTLGSGIFESRGAKNKFKINSKFIGTGKLEDHR